MTPELHPTLEGVLREARGLGFLGPGPVDAQIDHALGFAEAWGRDRPPPRRAADLGSGGGLPSLPLALAWHESRWTLIEAMVRRAAFLRHAVAALNLTDRVVVCEERAELFGRRPDHRFGYDLVTARGFGPPPVTAELAAPLLRIGGELLVSEPPEGSDIRWPAAGLGILGLSGATVVVARSGRYARITCKHSCDQRFPRRTGIPAKRPVFEVPRETPHPEH